MARGCSVSGSGFVDRLGLHKIFFIVHVLSHDVSDFKHTYAQLCICIRQSIHL